MQLQACEKSVRSQITTTIVPLVPISPLHNTTAGESGYQRGQRRLKTIEMGLKLSIFDYHSGKTIITLERNN